MQGPQGNFQLGAVAILATWASNVRLGHKQCRGARATLYSLAGVLFIAHENEAGSSAIQAIQATHGSHCDREPMVDCCLCKEM